MVPTDAALRFVGEATWTALSGRPIATSVWQQSHEVPHVRLGQQADLILVVPATADLLARATHGIASDLLTNVLLTARCPVLLAPAMHTEMWQHPATAANVSRLRERGIVVLEPDTGRLTGTDSGPGRLPDPVQIVNAAADLLRRRPSSDLAGLRIAISGGGTRESWDPVRYLGNRSSGRQAVALARTAVSRGAEVTLVAAAMDVPAPAGVRVLRVEAAAQLEQAMVDLLPVSEVIVMAAAVADYRPEQAAPSKVKKEDAGDEVVLRLTQTSDVLARLCRMRAGRRPLIVGFAAETAGSSRELQRLAAAKLARKGCDLLVANDVGADAVFGSQENAVMILAPDGSTVEVPRSGKDAIADAIWDHVVLGLAGA